LTASAGDRNALKVTAEIARVDTSGMLAESLRSGSLGDDLRDAASQLLLTAIQAVGDFKATLPAAIQNIAVVQNARFQDTSPGVLGVTLEGQVQISNGQATQLAAQLNQALSAQSAAPK